MNLHLLEIIAALLGTLVVMLGAEVALLALVPRWFAPLAFLAMSTSRTLRLPERGDGYRGREIARPAYAAVPLRIEMAVGVVHRSDDGKSYVLRRALTPGRRQGLWSIRIDLRETDDGLVMSARRIPTPFSPLAAAPLAVLGLAASMPLTAERWSVILPVLFVPCFVALMWPIGLVFHATAQRQAAEEVMARLELELLATLPRPRAGT